MRAMILFAHPARRSKRRRCPRLRPGPGEILGRGAGLRCLPHRSARRRWRACPIPSCRSCPATRSSVSSAALGAGVTRFARRRCASACRGSATPAVLCRYCRERTRKPLRRAALHRLPRSTAATPNHAVADARYCVRVARRATPTPEARAVAVRGADRLPRAAAWPATPRASAFTASAPLRTSSRNSHVLSRDARSFAFTRPGDTAAQRFAREARRRVGRGGSDETRAGRSARRGADLRAGRHALVPNGAARVVQGRDRGLCARHPHERHSVVPLFIPVGRAAGRFGGESDAPDAVDFIARAQRAAIRRASCPPPALPPPTKRSRRCATAR